MPYYKFNKRDLIYNRIKTYPKVEFTIARGPGDTTSKVYYNNRPQIDGKFDLGSPESGYINLYELNVDKLSGSVYDPVKGTTEDGDLNPTSATHNFGANNKIYPFIVKGSSMHSFSTVSSTGFHGISYGDEITSSYSLTASIQRLYYRENDSRKHVFALKSYLDRASTTSRHFAFTGSGGTNEEVDNGWDKSTQEMSIIDVPSIFYGNSIKKGSINLKFHINGALIGELSDIKNNGELIQIGPTGSTGSGSVAGIVMYDAGLFLLTGSWDLDTVERNYRSTGDNVPSKWVYFGYGIPTRALEESDEGSLEGQPQVINKTLQYVDMKSDGTTDPQFSINFRGVNYIPTVTMFCRAPKNQLNHSNNPTYVAHSASWNPDNGIAETITGSTIYREYDKQEINNVVYSAYNSITGSFQKTTFITQVKIYDEEMNCIGIAKVAKPVKKTPERDFTFKLKVDF